MDQSSANGGQPTMRCFGDYMLLGEIASGGMGVVYNARHLKLNKPVAVKVIRAGQMATEEEIQRFQTEAEAASKLDHPHIVSIYEIGQFEGQHYVTMRLVEGDSLAEQIVAGNWVVNAQNKAPAQRSIATLILKVAQAVHHAHQRGILHRDLKPGNILLDDKGEPHLTDFGLAKMVERPANLTLTKTVMGTPSYMAPEQAAGKSKDVTIAADVYSLGAVLYELLTGYPPFQGESPIEILQKATHEEPLAPCQVRPFLDRDLQTICLKCLEKESDRRYASADALALDLQRWLRGEPITARPVGVFERGWKWVRRHPIPVRMGAIIMVCVALGITAFIWQRKVAQKRELQKNLQQVERLFAERQPRLALATLAYLLRQDRDNRVAAERALNGLAQHGLFMPSGPSILGSFRIAQWSANGQFLLLAGNGEHGGLFSVYNRNRQLITAVSNGIPQVRAAAIDPDGTLIALSFLDRFQVWDLSSAITTKQPSAGLDAITPPTRPLLYRESLEGAIRQIQFLADRRLLTLTGDHIRLWSLPEGKVIHEYEAGSTNLLHMAVHAGADRLAGVTRVPPTLHVWRLDSGELLLSIPTGHNGIIRELSFSSDGSRLVTVSADHTARIWDIQQAQLMGTLNHDDAVNKARFSPDGTRIVTASRDGTARLWGAILGMRWAQSWRIPMRCSGQDSVRTGSGCLRLRTTNRCGFGMAQRRGRLPSRFTSPTGFTRLIFGPMARACSYCWTIQACAASFPCPLGVCLKSAVDPLRLPKLSCRPRNRRRWPENMRVSSFLWISARTNAWWPLGPATAPRVFMIAKPAGP